MEEGEKERSGLTVLRRLKELEFVFLPQDNPWLIVVVDGFSPSAAPAEIEGQYANYLPSSL